MTTATASMTIWTKTKEDGTVVEVNYLGFECEVVVGGKVLAAGRLVEVTAANRSRLRFPLEVTAAIGPVGFRGADAVALRSAVDRIREDNAAAEAARLETVLPGLSLLRDACDQVAIYNAKATSQIERGTVFTAAKPDVDLEALAAQYPAAWLYLRCESALATASYDVKVTALKGAIAILVTGGSVEDARKVADTWVK